MGYLCPVCEEPFGGGEPLANHLAVTAILHADEHETWLEETIADWESISRPDLAERLTDHADATSDHDHAGDHSHVDAGAARSGVPDELDAGAAFDTGTPAGGDSAPFSTVDTDALDAEARAIFEEAKTYTQAMQGNGDETAADADTEGKES
jgi:hypothetical protein